ncbi:MAG: hypothetical protein JWO83_2688 [Caulobacteraceae bacterium]|nr:hypothetical protein [Caulobacteraceae bacterium]
MTETPAASRAQSRERMGFVIGLYAVVLALLAAPLVAVVVPPLGDYPNHLARIHVLARYADSAPLRANYAVVWKLSPYLGMDLLAPMLANIVGIYAAGRLFLFLCLLQIVAGVAAIHAALYGRLSAWPAAGAIFAYSLVMDFGFANYLFGIGIWLLAFAGWIWLSRRGIAWRLVGGSLLSFAVFFSHYFALAGYMICVGAYELGVWLTSGKRDLRALVARGAIAFCPFIAPLILVALASHGQSGGVTSYGDPAFKLYALLSPVIFPSGGPNVAPAALLVVLGLLLLFPGRRRRLFGRLALAAPMRAPLAILALAALATPWVLSGVAWMDIRLPVALVWLLIASCEWREPSRRGGLIAAGVLVALLGLQMASIVRAWRPIGRQFDDFRAAAAVIPRGARVIAFRDDENIAPANRVAAFAYRHLPLLTVIERDAFMPTLFKEPMMSVQAAPALRDIDTPTGAPIELSQLIAGADPVKSPRMRGAVDQFGMRNYWGGWPNTFDYAVELSFGAHPNLPPQLRLVRSGAMFNIYRIARDASPIAAR